MFKSQSLNEHLQEAWNFGNILPKHFVIPVPAQQRTGEHWYRGTADAIYQNLNLIEDHEPEEVIVFGGDHIFLMNVNHMMDFARDNQADACVACLPFPISQAHQFGVIQVDEHWRIIGFQEKPEHPTPIPGNEEFALVSMGNYWFRREAVSANLRDDALKRDSSHDFGKDILPEMLASGQRLFAYDFSGNIIPGSNPDANDSYWRDVGTLDAYFDANMDLRAVRPQLDLYNRNWPIRTADSHLPPPKFVHNVEGRVGSAIQSIVCSGSIISGSTVIDSVIARECIINSYAEVRSCVLMDDVQVGRGAQLHRCIIDKHVRIPAGDRIGFDHVTDSKRFPITENGVVVIGKNTPIHKPE